MPTNNPKVSGYVSQHLFDEKESIMQLSPLYWAKIQATALDDREITLLTLK